MERILTFIALSLITTASAAAPQAAKPSDPTQLYVGAQLGDGVAGAMLGLHFNRSYALEVRYDYVDTAPQPNSTIKSNIVGGALLGFYPVKTGFLDQPLYVFGKAGYERKSTKTTVTDPGIPGFYPATTTATTTLSKRVVVGAGVQYDFSESVSGRVGANAVGHDHTVYIAAIYKF